MLKRLSFLFSMSFTGILLVILIVVLALTTFVESAYNTQTAWAVSYGTRWFEILFLLVAVNLAGVMIRKKYLKRKKITAFVFHIAFLLILAGAAITRFISYEGMMHIRENNSSSTIVSDNTYMDVVLKLNGDVVEKEQEVMLSELTPGDFRMKVNVGGQKVKVRSTGYISNAVEQFVPAPGGEPYIQLVAVAGRQTAVGIPSGTTSNVMGLDISFNHPDTSAIFRIVTEGDQLVAYAPFTVNTMRMGEEAGRTFLAGEAIPVEQGVLYSLGHVRMALQNYIPSARRQLVRATAGHSGSHLPAVMVEVETRGMKSELFVRGMPRVTGNPVTGTMGDLEFSVAYGSREIEVPFALYLEGFQVERYPGSNSPSSFASDVILVDEEFGIREERRIFMNNILKHRGYRFYQSSYDQDEMGTVLSVNKDRAGTAVTYLGYFVLMAGMVLALFVPGTRFARLAKKSAESEKENSRRQQENDPGGKKGSAGRRSVAIVTVKTVLAGLFLLGSTTAAFGQEGPRRDVDRTGLAQGHPPMDVPTEISTPPQEMMSEVSAQEVPPMDMAREFGALWVQDRDGRFEPMNTLSGEVVRKITKKSKFRGYNNDQVLLGMILYPEPWQEKPLFRLSHPELQRLTGFRGELVSFNDLMDTTGSGYVLNTLVNEAYSKQVAQQTELDREVIKLDDRVNSMILVQSGGLLRIFPNPESKNDRWASVSEALQGEMVQEGDTMATVFLHYLNDLQHGQYASAGARLELLLANQQVNEALLPPAGKKRLEIIYNRINLFPRLSQFYLVFGIFLLVLQFLIIFRPRKLYSFLFRVGVIHLAVALVLHTLVLAARWYISGHAPMSNGYESMIFLAWVTLLAGFIFVKQSGYAMALTAVLGGLALLVAQMSNMNPEITNLVPVLKSPWLAIHVTVIMAGYGFLGLASVMGLLNVVIYTILTPSNRERMKEVILQVTRVNHMTMIIGLYFMTAGTFLGGVWANESWGRYWGWDPKETWALITVLIYAFVVHMHRIPGLKGFYAFNLASFISYASVLMTYFGVNYFLGGIHSYASGSAFSLPWFTYILLIFFTGLATLAYYRQKKLLPDSPQQDV